LGEAHGEASIEAQIDPDPACPEKIRSILNPMPNLNRVSWCREPHMLTNAFVGQAKPPNDRDLSAELGPSRSRWDMLLRDLAKMQIDGQEWNSYSRKAGWALKVKREQRTILYLSPARGAFTVSFALGEKALQAARHSGLPDAVIVMIDSARRYAEGTAVRIEVRSAADVAVVKKLAAAKVDN